MNRRGFLLGLLGLPAAGCAPAGCAAGEPSDELPVAAGERGGLYYDFATLLAARLDPGLRARVVETEGSLANLDLLRSGGARVALTLADAARGADPLPDLRALGRVYENYLQLVVRADDPARHVADLAGRVVSLGAAGSGASLSGGRVLVAAGLAGRVRVEHLRLAEAARALVDRRVDALLWSGGVPTPVLARLPAVRLLPLAGLLGGLRAAHGSVYEQAPVPVGVYGSAREVATIGVANLLVCRAGLPDAVAASITRTLVSRAAALVPDQTVGTQYLDVRSLIGTTGLPLHPGAAAAYRDLHG
ncbi:TAXI family TRAP transporter solute-binding subunit [Saccharothrix algeriensis]|uniref:TRAP transporter TAXI family solute receptor n=1 Tax=Saccharothrix algeriensis TaxID=173560 RepID=A0ABS2RZX3_9PSEU|nr:TAXI family TRAP transporter solute-binding subunit [Saccharothrix algeriensis]MBM7809533.1 TRAP transporter TAXI family solute receptor [Saccharothrix algeriensis]